MQNKLAVLVLGTCGIFLVAFFLASSIAISSLPTVAAVTISTVSPSSVGLVNEQNSDIYPFIAHRVRPHCDGSSDCSDGIMAYTACGNSDCSSGNITQTVQHGGWPSVEFYDRGKALMLYDKWLSETDYRLVLQRCLDKACSTSNLTTFPSDYQDIGDHALTVGSDNLPFIVSDQYTQNPSMLTIIRCRDLDCTQYRVTNYQTDLIIDYGLDIAIGSDGFPTISFVERDAATSNSTLRVLKCLNYACSNWQVNSVDSGQGVGRYSTLVIQPNGNPLIVYNDMESTWSAWKIKLASCGNPFCSADNVITTLLPQNGHNPDITLSAAGLPIIAYTKVDTSNINSLELINCSTSNCSSWTTDIVDQGGWGVAKGINPNVSIGQDGSPVIAYMGDYPGMPSSVLFAKCIDGNISSCSQSVKSLIGDAYYYDNYGVAVSVDAS